MNLEYRYSVQSLKPLPYSWPCAFLVSNLGVPLPSWEASLPEDHSSTDKGGPSTPWWTYLTIALLVTWLFSGTQSGGSIPNLALSFMSSHYIDLDKQASPRPQALPLWNKSRCVTFKLCSMELLQLRRGHSYFYLSMYSHPSPVKPIKTSKTGTVHDWCVPFNFQQEHKEKEK